MNLLLRPGPFNPVPYRPGFTLEDVVFDDEGDIEDEELVPILMAVYKRRGFPK